MTDQQFVPLAQRYMDTIFRIAYSYLRSQADADDVTQDVLIQLYKTETAFESDDHLKHWLIRVTENILSVTKFTGSDVKLKKEDEAVEEIVSSAIVKFRRHHPEMSITVKRPESILWAPMDATLVEQVLLNLFENAAAHGKNANTIQVSILPEPGRAAVVVEDNGAGFSPEALEHLFDGLQPAGTGHSDNRRHMGIGLNVCRSIIRAHGGEITAGNGREGGAEIRFWLPREEEEEQDE